MVNAHAIATRLAFIGPKGAIIGAKWPRIATSGRLIGAYSARAAGHLLAYPADDLLFSPEMRVLEEYILNGWLIDKYIREGRRIATAQIHEWRKDYPACAASARQA